MVERAFDHRLGAGLAIAFEKLALQGTGIDADADRTAMVLGRLHNIAHPVRRADIARIDPKARRARLSRLDAALIVKMDIGDQGHLGGLDDGLEGCCRFHIGTGDPDNVGPGLFQLTDLIDGRASVRGQGVGHGLDRDGRIAPDLDRADADLARRTALNHPPGADMGQPSSIRALIAVIVCAHDGL